MTAALPCKRGIVAQASLISDLFSIKLRNSSPREYRDTIDVAKLFQLVPGIGAPVGAYVNHRFTYRLGTTAMNAYRMRRMTTP
jgi:hypothetical protein